MHGPEVVSWLLVALCAATGTYGLARAWRLHRDRYRTEQSALLTGLMGMGMAVMALPSRLVSLPPVAFSVFFALLTGWALFGGYPPGIRHGRHLHHALEGLAMVYMALVLHPGSAHAGHSGSGHPHATADPSPVAVAVGEQDPGGSPVLTGALLVYLTFRAVRVGVRVPALAAGADSGAGAGAHGSSAWPEATVGRTSPSPGAERGLTEACHGILALSCAVMLLVS